MNKKQRTVFEICAGAGGQSLGLEQAGFRHVLAVEIDEDAAQTLRANRPEWHVETRDVREINGIEVPKVDLFAGGVPCPPFSSAGKQLGADDERDLFPEALRLVRETRPRAVMLENVKGLSTKRFEGYRAAISDELTTLGYASEWRLLNSSDYGVPQLRPRLILVALEAEVFPHFEWPEPNPRRQGVGSTLVDLMAENGWRAAEEWARAADVVAPTIVGGSKKHGGPDLGPTRARAAWLELGVDGRGVADAAPEASKPHDHTPRLTNRMVARVQGFPDSWQFVGRKTSVYRQVGNAFPPPVARAVGSAIHKAISMRDTIANASRVESRIA